MPGPAVAQIGFTAKIIDADGKVVGAKVFEATAPAPAIDTATQAATALDAAFGKASTDLVVWALGTIHDAAAAAAAAPKPDATDNATDGGAAPDAGNAPAPTPTIRPAAPAAKGDAKASASHVGQRRSSGARWGCRALARRRQRASAIAATEPWLRPLRPVTDWRAHKVRDINALTIAG